MHVGAAVVEVRKAWSAYQALATQKLKLPIWAVAENYRFEPGLIQVQLSRPWLDQVELVGFFRADFVATNTLCFCTSPLLICCVFSVAIICWYFSLTRQQAL
jgi:hypothetical protein